MGAGGSEYLKVVAELNCNSIPSSTLIGVSRNLLISKRLCAIYASESCH